MTATFKPPLSKSLHNRWAEFKAAAREVVAAFGIEGTGALFINIFGIQGTGAALVNIFGIQGSGAPLVARPSLLAKLAF